MKFVAFCEKLGFKVTVEPQRVAGLKTFCGKVIDGMGKTATDAVRHIHKFFSSWSCYGKAVNMNLKWAGFYTEALGKGVEQMNLFQLIGRKSYNLLKNSRNSQKYMDTLAKEAELRSVHTGESGHNTTFDVVFGEDLPKLVQEFENYQDKDITMEQYIEVVDKLISPYVRKMMDVTGLKPGILTISNIPIIDNRDYKNYTTKALKKQVDLFNYSAQIMNEIMGSRVVKYVAAGTYISDAIKICKSVGISVIEDWVSRGTVKRNYDTTKQQQTNKAKIKQNNQRQSKIKVERGAQTSKKK